MADALYANSPHGIFCIFTIFVEKKKSVKSVKSVCKKKEL